MTLDQLVEQAEQVSYYFQPQERKVFRECKRNFEADGELSPDETEQLVELVERYG